MEGVARGMRSLTVRRSVVCVLGIIALIVVVIGAATATGRTTAGPAAIRVALPESGWAPQRQADGTCTFATNGSQQAGRAGEPDLPVQVVTVLLPPDADLTTVRATIPGYGWTAIDGQWDISPVSPVSTGSPAERTFAAGKDPRIYEENALYPADPVRKVDIQVMRGWKMAQVVYAPFACNPVEKQVCRLFGTAIEVTFRRTAAGAGSDGVDLGAADSVRETVVNFDAVGAEYGLYAASAPDSGRYVIITTAAIEEDSGTLMDFVASKEARGFTVQVVTEDTWGGGTGNTAANNLRSWLKSNYLALDIEYVLLIGDPDPSHGDVPMKMCYPQEADPDYPECPTDFFYAELTSNWNADGDSRYGEFIDDFWGSPPRAAEVAVGRIPFYGDTADLDRILAKIVAYENAPAGSISWRENVLLPMKPSDEETPGYQLGEEIKNRVLGPAGWAYHRVYDSNYWLSPAPETVPCNIANVTSAWKRAGYGAVIWWTHGTSTSASYVMNTSNAATLDDNHPSLAFQCSCLNGTPESSSNLGYSLLLNGCISTVCASRVSWYEIGQTSFAGSATNAGMAFEYAQRVIAAGMYAGDALTDLKTDVVPAYEELWMNYLDFNLYGDPAVGLSNSAPDSPAPSVLTYYPRNVATKSARLRANLASKGQVESVNLSFQWGTASGLYDGEIEVGVRSTTGTYYSDLTGLNPGTTYYYRAVAEGWSTSYGDEKSFTTLTTPPSVSSGSVTAITSSSARLNGSLSSLGTAATVSVSFQWGTSPGSYDSETAPQPRTATGAFQTDLTGLQPDTTYYCRAKAAGDSTAYGAQRTFTTPLAPPTVETALAAIMDGTSAHLNGRLYSTGSASSVTVSFQWGTSPGTYGRTTTAETMQVPGNFSSTLTRLTPGTTYYYRAAADGAGSPVYGLEQVFTMPVTPPAVTSGNATNVEMTTATINGELISTGTAGTATVSFEWGEAPGVYDHRTDPVSRTAAGAFQSSLSGLAPGTTYYYRARADGQGEPSHGLEMSFTTATTYPRVATGSATSITTSSATINGELVSRGLSDSVQVSFEWGTAPGAYDHETPSELMTATGPYRYYLTGLDSGATLYYRTKAVGYGDPVYGTELVLTVFRRPLIAAVSPAAGAVGQSLTVAISGSAFTTTPVLSLGPNIVVSGFEVVTDDLIIARVLIPCDTAAGSGDVCVTTGGGAAVLTAGFTVVDSAPFAPRNVAPLDGVGTTTLTPALHSSAFSHPCPARTHTASQWQLTGTAGSYGRPAFDSGADTANLTTMALPVDVVESYPWCWWRVRYQDNRGNWSEWSSETSFAPPSFVKAALDGAAEIIVLDSQGLATGSLGGQVQQRIPQSAFDNGTVTVLSPAGTQRYQVCGTQDGTYTLTVTRLAGDHLLAFRAAGIPVSAGEIHEYTIDWNRVYAGGEAATIHIDSDGDGASERTAVVAADIGAQDFLSAGDGRRGVPAWAWVLAGLGLAIACAAGALLVARRRGRGQAGAGR